MRADSRRGRHALGNDRSPEGAHVHVEQQRRARALIRWPYGLRLLLRLHLHLDTAAGHRSSERSRVSRVRREPRALLRGPPRARRPKATAPLSVRQRARRGARERPLVRPLLATARARRSLRVHTAWYFYTVHAHAHYLPFINLNKEHPSDWQAIAHTWHSEETIGCSEQVPASPSWFALVRPLECSSTTASEDVRDLQAPTPL